MADDAKESTTSPATKNTASQLSDTQSDRPQTPSTRPSSSASSTSRIGPGQFKRQKKLEDKVLATVGDKLADIKREDQFDVFGRNVAVKLRSLPHEHRIYAEKKINDALFESELAAFQEQSMTTRCNVTPINSFVPSAEPTYRQQPQTENMSAQFAGSSNVPNLSNYYSNYIPNPQQQ